MNIIINADDFAISEKITNKIIDFYVKGYISQTTLMVNMPFCDEAINLAQIAGMENSIGLHLNLTEGHPLSENIKNISLFCNIDGEFSSDFMQSKKNDFYLDKYIRNCLQEEINAQMVRYLEYNLSLRHLDSHRHIHIYLSILKILIPIAKDHGFQTMRKSRNIGEYPYFKSIYKHFINNIISENFKTTTIFGSYSDYYDSTKPIKREYSVELMCHPANPVYINESTMIESESLKNLHDYSLISYKELK